MKKQESHKSPALHIEEFQLVDVEYRTLSPDEIGDWDRGGIEFGVARNEEDPSRIAVQLSFNVSRCSKEGGGFDARMSLLGYFAFDKESLQESLESDAPVPKVVVVNSLAILWGIARGYFGTVAGWGKQSYVLPSIHFPSVVDHIQNQRSEEAPAE